MKVCLSNKQINSYLEKVDEISFEYKDKNKILDFLERFENKDMVLFHSYFNDVIDWDEIENINILSMGHFIFALDNIEDCRIAASKSIKFFYNRKITTYLELNMVKEIGSCYIIPGEPLFFQMDLLKQKEVKIRVIPNLVLLNSELYPNGVLGSWIRPEDMEVYEEYIDAIEFYTADSEEPIAKERGLYRVYCVDKEWLEELRLLITDLNYPGNNGLIDPEYSRLRLNCGQKCQERVRCNICYKILDLANVERVKNYLDKVNGVPEAENAD